MSRLSSPLVELTVFSAILSTVGLGTFALLLAGRGGSAEFKCEGEGPVDATYNFGPFDGRFVDAIKPVSGCNLGLQAKGTNVRMKALVGDRRY